MNNPNKMRWALPFLSIVPVLSLALTSGCSGLLQKPAAPPLFFALDGVRSANPEISVAGAEHTVIVNPTRAAPGFDSGQIIYVRTAHQLEHFAHSEWVDTPARMLAPLIVAAIERTGSFRAIVPATSGVAGDLRLDTELLRLQQEFGDGPSRVRFTLRATLIDNETRHVIAWREFEASIASESEDPYGGVVAANRAVQRVLGDLARFCASAPALWDGSKRSGSTPN